MSVNVWERNGAWPGCIQRRRLRGWEYIPKEVLHHAALVGPCYIPGGVRYLSEPRGAQKEVR
jgi:hypothetical protein